MKLKLTPAELIESYKLFNTQERDEFINMLMDYITSEAVKAAKSSNNDTDTTDEDYEDYEDMAFEGLPSIIVNSDKPAQRLTVRVEIKGIKPPIWRKLVIPSNLMLESFAHVILFSMGWEMNHLHQFIKDDIFYCIPNDDFTSIFKSIKKEENSILFTVGDLISQKDDKCVFEYDFGDSWAHLVTVKEVRDYKVGENLTQVSLIGGKRACPLEDVGGVWGYIDYLEALKHPRNKENKERIEWFGKIDPEEFDLETEAKNVSNIPCNGK